MIDVSTIHALELIQNLHNVTSKDCLFGLLDETQTLMGSRLLRSNILQPLTDIETIVARHDALAELIMREKMFFALRQGSYSKTKQTDDLLTKQVLSSSAQIHRC